MDQVRIGMIGVSGRGRIAELWHQPMGRSLIVAGADINPNHLESFRNDINPDAFTTLDYREMLQRDDMS
jgi:predicted dehydrogenase